MKIALATPPFPRSISDGLLQVETLVKEAAAQKAAIVCFPESYLPGYRMPEYEVEPHSPEKLKAALVRTCEIAKENNIAIILPMDWPHPDGILNVAYVISAFGEIMGHQTKNQLDPSEDEMFIPGTDRHIFKLQGVKFGIVICHEGFRYPELVRWAARQGAKVVFHPHFTGSDAGGVQLKEWGDKNSPYYEKAMMMRAMENTIYFASVGYATQYQEAASSIIAPDGKCIASQPYGEPGIITAEIDPEKASGLLAMRYKPELFEKS